MKPMTGIELRVAIAQLGTSQMGLSKTLGVDGRTVRKWIEAGNVPQATAMLIRILVSRRNWNDLVTVGYGGTK
jgi:DNA-binding transcriptional regulator YiaG